ncbi:hypothetical protein F4802DRAFT_598380 [Xylaria palmicola]|nr:hypothetical protein F4802DRAFT_598380 [Xylaria palmicola]
MKIHGLALFTTLALSACLSRSVDTAGAVAAVEQGDAEVQAGVIGNNTAVADDANEVNQDENQDNQNDEEGNEVENGEEDDEVQDNEEGNEVDNGDEGNEVDNGDENDNENINDELEDNLNDINIDPNDIQGSLQQNILDLLLSMGICNFNLNSLQGIGLNNQIQLLLQLQQLQQLQALGIVNSFAVDQLIQQELLSQTFNLNIIKRSIDASVRQASRGKKRTTMLRRQCSNVGQSQGDVNNGADNVDQDQANQDQANQDQANKDQAEQDQENQDEADGQGNEAEEENANAGQASDEGVEVE